MVGFCESGEPAHFSTATLLPLSFIIKAPIQTSDLLREWRIIRPRMNLNSHVSYSIIVNFQLNKKGK